MPITTVNPTSNTTPNIGGDSAESGMSNTGHTTTTTLSSAHDLEGAPLSSDSDASSARWESFSAVPGGLISLRLKFSWTISADVGVLQTVAGSGSASITYNIDYTVDGGSNWINAVSRSLSVTTNNIDSLDDGDAYSVDLSTSQNVSLVKVRDRLTSSALANAPNVPGAEVSSDSSLSTTVSSIRLEAETSGGGSAGYRTIIGS